MITRSIKESTRRWMTTPIRLAPGTGLRGMPQLLLRIDGTIHRLPPVRGCRAASSPPRAGVQPFRNQIAENSESEPSLESWSWHCSRRAGIHRPRSTPVVANWLSAGGSPPICTIPTGLFAIPMKQLWLAFTNRTLGSRLSQSAPTTSHHGHDRQIVSVSWQT